MKEKKERTLVVNIIVSVKSLKKRQPERYGKTLQI